MLKKKKLLRACAFFLYKRSDFLRNCRNRALTKLLLSVDWGVDSEVAQVEGLLAQWARQAPIDAPDALKLLGRERTFQAEVVRRFAVDALRRASDEELLAFLLQLVQVGSMSPTVAGFG